MRCVVKAFLEVLGRGGWISRFCHGSFAGGAGGFSPFGGEEGAAMTGCCASTAVS